MGSREQNERKFEQWDELSHGKRLYKKLTQGRNGWFAKYLKEVDSNEMTLRFWQEIYDEAGTLVEVHEKFPVDKGHKKV